MALAQSGVSVLRVAREIEENATRLKETG